MKKLLFSALVMLMLTSFSERTCKDNEHVLLVLKDTNNQESFSVFSVKENNGVLVGANREEYVVNDGVYRIEGASDDKFYHKHIMIQND